MPEDPNTAGRIFGVYKKMLELSLAGRGVADAEFVRDHGDLCPHMEDLTKLADVTLNPDSFPLDEFIDFVNHPTGAVNHSDSEKLWPVAPALRYYDDN